MYFPAGVPATFTYTITNGGPDLASNLVVIDQLNTAVNSVPITFSSASSTAGTCTTVTTSSSVSCTIGNLQAGSIATVTFVVIPSPNTSGTAQSFNGGSVSVLAQGNIVTGPIQVPAQMSDFGITVSPSSESVPLAGDTATYQVQITPAPVYANPISISCSNLPTSATCPSSPASVTLEGSSPASATLSITTTAQSIVGANKKSTFGRFFALWFVVPGLALLGVGARKRKGHHLLGGMLLLMLILIQLIPLPGCNNKITQPPPTGTPPGSYTITVTATSGSDTKSVPIQLTVP